MERLKKRRASSKLTVENLINKTQNLNIENLSERDERELKTTITVIQSKMEQINQLNEKILDEITVEEMENDMLEATDFEIKINTELKRFDKITNPNLNNVDSESISSENSSSIHKKNVSLPKIFIKKFYGDPLQWQTFHDTFKATVIDNSSLSNIEKFSYLKGYLTGDAERCIQGIPMTDANFDSALELLIERYGLPQICIGSHMDKLVKLKPLNHPNVSVKELRLMYDNIESHVRSLLSLGINSEHYGAMLVPIILEKLPYDIRLVISRTLGNDTWKIQDLMKLLKNEINARENCEVNSTRKRTNFEDDFTKSTTSTLYSNHGQQIKCTFCSGSHYSDKCNVITDTENRKQFVYDNKLCFKCLSPRHNRKNCRSKNRCYVCKLDSHHTALCFKNNNININSSREGTAENRDEIHTTQIGCKSSILLQTTSAIAKSTNESQKIKINILLDSGSQKSYVSRRLVQKLNLQPISEEKISLSTFADPGRKNMAVKKYPLCLETNSGMNFYLNVLDVPTICSPVSNKSVQVALKEFPFLRDNPDFTQECDRNTDIDLLLGLDVYYSIITGEIRRCSKDNLVAINTIFGWIISGTVHHNETNLLTHVLRINTNENETLSQNVHKFWDLDTIGIKENEPSIYDKFVEETKLVDNRYEVCLPFKENKPMLNDNFSLCLRNVKKLREKLLSTPNILTEYNNIINDQINTKILERVTDDGKIGEVVYIPHKAVIREDKQTSKVRIVLNASAKRNGPSLNDCLYKGPTLNPLLYEILLRFRLGNVALSTDLEKAFLQISVRPEDRNYQRILWFDDVFADNPAIVKYRYTRVIYGSSSSQYLHNATIKKHAETFQKIDPEFTRQICDSFYVDDGCMSVDNFTIGINLYKKITHRFTTVNLIPQKWRTNSNKLREEISKTETIMGEIGGKILGLTWNEITDEFILNPSDTLKNLNIDRDTKVTKRLVLSFIAGFYDPIGFISHITIRLKIFFQLVCKSNINWDEKISEELYSKWLEILNWIGNMKSILISRCYFFKNVNDPIETIELIGFSDSSLEAYACVAYFRTFQKSGNIKVSFISSKSRVTPLKSKLSICRLELLGNLILSRLIITILSTFKDYLIINNILCFTDSMDSLGWIRATKKEFKPFVENRVIEIRKNVEVDSWFYINTKENPCDIATRISINASDSNDVWYNGSDSLKQNNIQTKKIESLIDTTEFNSEIKIDATQLLTNNTSEQLNHRISNIIDATRYGSLLKLIRVTAYVTRFVKAIKNNTETNVKQYPSFKEITEANEYWIKDNQTDLENEPNFTQLKTQLNIKKDNNGVLRSYGRYKDACLPDETKYPIVLHKNYFVTLLINYYHIKCYHRGVAQTLSEFRRHFWITKGRSFIKKIIDRCILCKKINVRPFQYPGHSDMPITRFEDTFPFINTGCDYLGPLNVKPIYNEENNELFKAYIVLYTCASTRAIILEVVNSLDSINFIQSLRRFKARRGCPNLIISDNGSSFTSDLTKKYVAENLIDWQHNPACASWWGGQYERLVGCVKRCLKKSLWKTKINYIELQTVTLEIETVLNNPPLYYVSENDTILTPNQLLFGRNLNLYNINNISNDTNNLEIDIETMNKNLRSKLEHFWNIWRKDYLLSLREIHKINKTIGNNNLKVNDIVLIHSQYYPRQSWKMGKITEIMDSRDKKIRWVKLRSNGQEITRPINKLYPLEIHNSEKDNTSETSRPKRSAAAVGELKRQLMM